MNSPRFRLDALFNRKEKNGKNEVARDTGRITQYEELGRALGARLRPVLNLLGSVDGASDWREGLKDELAHIGIPETQLFNPKVANWGPENLKNERDALRYNAAHYVNITNESAGLISNLESGLVALRAFLTGAKAYFEVAPLTADTHNGELRARTLITSALEATHRLHAENIDTPDDLSRSEWFAQVAQGFSGTTATPPRTTPGTTGTLERKIFISGTSAPATQSNAKGVIESVFDGTGMAYEDSFDPSGTAFGRDAMLAEQKRRMEAAVTLNVITNERASYGATAETFWLALQALLNGQRFGVYIEPSDDAELKEGLRHPDAFPNATTEELQVALKRAKSLRSALTEHLEALEEDFPGLVHVASSPEELAAWAARAVSEMGLKYPARFPIPENTVSWDATYPSYAPTYFVAPSVIANDERVKKGGWAHPEDITLVDTTTLESFTGPLRFNEKGLPLNPRGRTGIEGRGLLGKWGANRACDTVITRTNPATNAREVLLIKRKDGGAWALPGGMVDKGEAATNAAARELKEEAGVDLSFTDATSVYDGYVDDPRNTDNAWMETSVYHLHLSPEQAMSIQPKAGDDATSFKWLPVTPGKVPPLYASHTQLIERALAE